MSKSRECGKEKHCHATVSSADPRFQLNKCSIRTLLHKCTPNFNWTRSAHQSVHSRFRSLGVGRQLSPVPSSHAVQLLPAQTDLNLHTGSRYMLTCFHEVSSYSGNWSTHQASHTLFPCVQRGPGGPWLSKNSMQHKAEWDTLYSKTTSSTKERTAKGHILK